MGCVGLGEWSRVGRNLSIHTFIHSFFLLLLISVEDFARRKTISYRIMAEDGGVPKIRDP
jgi:hypothetical protein